MKPIARWIIASLALLPVSTTARAGTPEDIRATYEAFAAAQNRHDLAAVKRLLLDSPRFLWVSDGQSYWGPEALVERMAIFQQSEVWQVRPALDEAVAVPVGEHAGYLHLPLVLDIGSRTPGPDHLAFLVSVLCVETPDGWRIAALFTTTRKQTS
jgi:ketosteroid isomerase-like protein